MRNVCFVKQNAPLIIDCHNHLGVDLLFYLNGFHPYAQDLPALVTEGRRHGVDRWVVFPMVSSLFFDLAAMQAGRLEPGGLERVPYAFENERLLREVHELHPSLGRWTLPFVIVDPMREPAAQAQVLRTLRSRFPFHGLKVQGTIIQADVGALRREGRPLLDFAAEFDLPFLIHSSIAPDDAWSQAATILQVAAATPEVRFCLAHSCRFDRASLDRVAELPNAWFDCSAHRIHCEAVQRDLPLVARAADRFPADYRDPAAVLHALAEAYPNKLIWGSDTPFQSYVAMHDGQLLSLLSTYEEEVACLHGLPAPLRDRVAHRNLLDLLRLPDESLLARS